MSLCPTHSNCRSLTNWCRLPPQLAAHSAMRRGSVQYCLATSSYGGLVHSMATAEKSSEMGSSDTMMVTLELTGPCMSLAPMSSRTCSQPSIKRGHSVVAARSRKVTVVCLLRSISESISRIFLKLFFIPQVLPDPGGPHRFMTRGASSKSFSENDVFGGGFMYLSILCSLFYLLISCHCA